MTQQIKFRMVIHIHNTITFHFLHVFWTPLVEGEYITVMGVI